MELLIAHLEQEHLRKQLTNGAAVWSNNVPVARSFPKRSILQKISELTDLSAELERQKRSIRWVQNLKYPVVMLVLLVLTALSAAMVGQNTLLLVFGFKSLPSYRQDLELGNSMSIFGSYGAFIEVLIIIYLMAASLVGLYSFPLLRRLKPTLHQSSMTKVIANCMAVLVLSSALPVLARTLGITNFDLLGNYGRIDWLGNFYLVLSYNLVFVCSVCVCLATKFTATLRQELCKRFNEVGARIRYRKLLSESLNIEPENHCKSG